ncbi:hypothetical protein [Thermogemmatispora sp.]|uniref:hypothetical protein n=1 Tax=Thermogemmatispora sp. TaxID=1968838 RepID=UPI0035E44DD4
MRWFDRLLHEMLHGLLRVVALVFSAASAASIFWLFSDVVQGWLGMIEAGAVTSAFALTGFLVMRAIALRVLSKRRLGMLLGVALVYEWVEVVANVLHALVALPRLQWLGSLAARWPAMWWVVVLTLSILPLTTLVLAALDADLMRERGAAPVSVSGPEPKRVVPSTVSPAPPAQRGPAGPVAEGPRLPVPLNPLQKWYQDRRTASGG